MYKMYNVLFCLSLMLIALLKSNYKINNKVSYALNYIYITCIDIFSSNSCHNNISLAVLMNTN